MHKLYYYLHKFGNQVSQGSSEWLQERQYSFGGSEMGTVLGHNANEKFETLVQKKINPLYTLKDFCIWGRLFEQIAKHYIQKEFGNIYEFGSVSHPMYPVSYSPDGILLNADKTDLILLEIKNPIKRGVQNMPDIYYHQVQTGLSIFNAEKCMFAQFRFRRCKRNEKPFDSKYDRAYHKEYRKRAPDSTPISYGFIVWRTDHYPVVDLSSYEEMSDLLNEVPNEIVPEIHIEKAVYIDKGIILMWKLFEKEITYIKPDLSYLQKYEKEIWGKYKTLVSSLNKNSLDEFFQTKNKTDEAKNENS